MHFRTFPKLVLLKSFSVIGAILKPIVGDNSCKAESKSFNALKIAFTTVKLWTNLSHNLLNYFFSFRKEFFLTRQFTTVFLFRSNVTKPDVLLTEIILKHGLAPSAMGSVVPCICVFPILVLKLSDVIELVELDKCFIDSGVCYLWIVIFTYIVKITVHG